MNGWFWSSGLGPGPLAGAGLNVSNGLAGNPIRIRKKELTTNSVPSD
jgi:hypothetical protein